MTDQGQSSTLPFPHLHCCNPLNNFHALHVWLQARKDANDAETCHYAASPVLLSLPQTMTDRSVTAEYLFNAIGEGPKIKINKIQITALLWHLQSWINQSAV